MKPYFFQPDRKMCEGSLPVAAGNSRRKAVVIIGVLVVIVILTLIAYRYVDLMTEEYRAAGNVVKAAQAKALAESGVWYTAMAVSNAKTFTAMLNGNPFNNASVFQQIQVFESPTGTGHGYFSVMSGPMGNQIQANGQSYRFGLIDESSKININAIMRLDKKGDRLYNMLLQLPNMDQTLAARIVDYVDMDNEVRQGGAENSTYQGMDPPYRAKNGPLDSLDELLLVEGMTPQILYGSDLNRNGMIDPDEPSTDAANPLGLSAYLTIYSREQNIYMDASNQAQGYLPRLNLNNGTLADLHPKLQQILTPEMATYVILYRYYGGEAVSTDKSSSGSNNKTSSNKGNEESDGTAITLELAAGSDGLFTVQFKGGGGKGGSSSGGSPGGGGVIGRPGGGGMGGKGGSAGGKDGNSGGKSGDNKSGKDSSSNKTPEPIIMGVATDLPEEVDLTQVKKTTKIRSAYSLINTQVKIPGKTSKDPAKIYLSPLNDDKGIEEHLPGLLHTTTVTKKTEIPARVNINTAPEGVLMALTGLTSGRGEDAKPILTQEDVQAILNARPEPGSTDAASQTYMTPAWLVTQAKLKPDTVRSLESYITTQTQVFRFQVVGFFDNGGPMARLEAVVDTNAGRPRIVHIRDLSLLGKGFDMSVTK